MRKEGKEVRERMEERTENKLGARKKRWEGGRGMKGGSGKERREK